MKNIFATLLMITFYITNLYASPPVEQMQKNTVLVLCIVNDRDGDHGSGFVINNTDIVTNYHVVSCVSRGGLIYIMTSPETKLNGKIFWQSKTKDIAVIRAESSLNRPSSVLASSSSAKATDTVYAGGFPLGFSFLDIQSNFTVKISKGVVTAKVKTRDNVKLLQVDAPINPGNSGGPLFNEDGNVIGINWAKAQNVVIGLNPEDLSLTAQIVPSGEGIGWAIESDELIAELQSAGISFRQANILWSFPIFSIFKGNLLLFAALFTAIIIVAGTLFIIIKQRTGKKQSEIKKNQGLAGLQKPSLIVLDGPLKGAIIEFDNRPITIGRDPSKSNLIIPDSENTISKSHCTIRFDAMKGGFYIIDHSRNGTFLQDGTRLSNKQETYLRSGSRFYLSKTNNLFEVRVKD